MFGNVWEWTWDGLEAYGDGDRDEAVVDPLGPNDPYWPDGCSSAKAAKKLPSSAWRVLEQQAPVVPCGQPWQQQPWMA